MTDTLIRISAHAWLAAHRIASYVMQNWLDDPALLAMAFC